MNRAVFLRRDNIIIPPAEGVGDPKRVRLIQGSASAITSLRGLGYKVIVISDQAGAACGAFTETKEDAINDRIAALVKKNSGGVIDVFYDRACLPNSPPEGAAEEDRREHPGTEPHSDLPRQAAGDWDLDLPACWVIGGQPCDIETGRAIGARTVFLTGPAPRPGTSPAAGVEADFTAENLAEAARVIAQQPRADRPVKRVTRPTSEPIEPGPITEQPARSAENTAARPTKEAAEPPPLPHQPDPPAEPVQSEPAAEAGSPDPPVPPPPPADETAVDLLRQIRRDLRSRRAAYDDFSFNKMLAGVFQMVAVGCVLFGLLHLGQPLLFLQWLGGAVLSQLLVITLLIAHGQR